MNSAYYAGGCFWGVEYYMQKHAGVISVVSGYMGGHLDNPQYAQVKTGTTGHYECVRVDYNPLEVSYERLTKLFFEIHDPVQKNGQGYDIGTQYRSAIFYRDESEKEIASNLIEVLKSKGYDVATRLLPVSRFWEAEAYHQDYYDNNGKIPDCHSYVKRF
ncbi:MAG: peptide-methionine (S)-S-oxide reductase MsrA [Bacteroidales bacterium]|nr:peptide-methionine (S)-S-oxide reductase MsrA [Bacteroidales bacterium]MDD4670293.1 peptide-methionine (S)-S-oxide reductase MsrA [Bacteroidales bacterium]